MPCMPQKLYEGIKIKVTGLVHVSLNICITSIATTPLLPQAEVLHLSFKVIFFLSLYFILLYANKSI